MKNFILYKTRCLRQKRTENTIIIFASMGKANHRILERDT